MERAQNHVARKSGFDGDFCRFEVSDLADHDDVRVLSEEGAEGCGEVEADGFVHLYLVDAHEVEFDRVFGGRDVVADGVEFGEGGIQRRRFTGTRRAGDEDHAVGAMDGVFEVFEGFFFEA